MNRLATVLCLLLCPFFLEPAAGQGTGEGSGKPAKESRGDSKAKKKQEPAPAGSEPGEDDHEAAFDKLLEQFKAEKDEKPFLRVLTIEKFGDHPTKRTVVFLVAILKEENSPAIAGAVVRALGKIGTREAVAGIVQLGVPLIAGDINAAALATALANTLDDPAEEWLIKNGLSEPVRKNRETYKMMLDAIGRLRSEKRIGLLEGEIKRATSPESQVLILRLFAELQQKSAARIAHAYLKERDPQVLVAALQVLLAVKAKEYARDYGLLLKSKNWQVRALGVDLVAMAAQPDAVKLLTPLLTDPELRVRVGTVQALAWSGSQEAVAPLIHALQKNEGRVLDDLADVLARLTGKNFGTNAVQWESWWASNKGKAELVRRSAADFAKLKEADADKMTVSAAYFGLRVISKHVAFVIDSSDSMSEGYEPPPGRGAPQPVEPPPPEESGKTVAKPKPPRAGNSGPGGKAGARKKGLVPKIDVAKRELLSVLEHLPGGVLVNVIRFSTLAEAWKPALTLLDDATRHELTGFVKASKPDGLTNLYGALEEALKDEKLDTIYLLTDGAPTVGLFFEKGPLLTAVSRLNQIRKVKINTIGFGLNPDEKELLEALADQNYGVFLER
jgi:HEAT repeat protein